MDFLKVEGAGNDFVLLDARRRKLPSLSSSFIRRLLDRHRGIGGDGLLVLSREASGSTRVRYWNADGGAAAFCGNGARCVAHLLLRESRGAREVGFVFGRKRLRARRGAPQRVAVLVPMPKPLRLPRRSPPQPGRIRRWAWIDSGVPHWCFQAARVDALDLAAVAPPLRRWKALGPAGTNVDAVEILREVVHVRTWERGVEGETQACGSGLVAAGFFAVESLGARYPVTLRSRGGDAFRMWPEDGGEGLWLEGPARVAFAGTFELRARTAGRANEL